MKRVGIALLLGALWVLGGNVSAHALSSDPKLFISANNTFYAYANAGETIGASFARVNQPEPFDTVQGDDTVTIEGPGVAQQSCVLKADVPIGQGCNFVDQTAPQSGIWRIQFIVPLGAKPYPQVAPTEKWAKNLFSWTISVKSNGAEQPGRIWTNLYAIRQPAPTAYLENLTDYYVSEDGYIYKATENGYNGQISTLSADSIGIRSGTGCVSAYQSTDVSNADFSPAYGTCGDAYKLFFEQPAGDMPTYAKQWDGKSDWVLPNVSHPSISNLSFKSDNSSDQQSGMVTFYLHNFIGQYQVKIDADNDGNFDGQSDVVLNEQVKSLTGGLQQIHFQGVDRQGQIILPSQTIGIEVVITKVAEIHLVAADVEGRTGGIELTRENGDNAPTTRICWNDTNLEPLADTTLMTPKLDGRNCPDSTGGVHGWAYNDASWGNDRYIDDWTYASATLTGNNKIIYPDPKAVAAAHTTINWLLVSAVLTLFIIIIAVIIVVIVRRKRKNTPLSAPPMQQIQTTGNDNPPVPEN